MPFDVVWIDNFHRMSPLLLKNLIGRSGRTTPEKNYFDYGYTIIKRKNIKTFKERFKKTIKLSEVSSLDSDIDDVDEDLRDIVVAIKEDTFNEELHLTDIQVERINSANLGDDVKYILDSLLDDNNAPLTGKTYYNLTNYKRKKIKTAFKEIYIQHLRRKELTDAEKSILSTSIPILLWHIQGKSFSEIVSLRYAFLSNKDERAAILKRVKNKEITPDEADQLINKIKIRYSPIPAPLPDKSLIQATLYPQNTSVKDFDFDTIVYDTYDYLDKVISLSISDPICAALEIHFQKTKDNRAEALKNYIRFGTNDDVEIWLLKYGFSFEEIDWLKEHVEHIDASKITFRASIERLDEEKRASIERYI